MDNAVRVVNRGFMKKKTTPACVCCCARGSSRSDVPPLGSCWLDSRLTSKPVEKVAAAERGRTDRRGFGVGGGGRQSLAARLRCGQLAAPLQTKWLHSSDNGWTAGASREERLRGSIVTFISHSTCRFFCHWSSVTWRQRQKTQRIFKVSAFSQLCVTTVVYYCREVLCYQVTNVYMSWTSGPILTNTLINVCFSCFLHCFQFT